MRTDVEKKFENCLTCQLQSTARKRKRRARLQATKVRIRSDKFAAVILGPVTKTKRGSYKYLLVLKEYFTKFVVSVLLQNTITETGARKIVKNHILLPVLSIQFILIRA